jgi:Predicted membrane protein (DUF2254)
VTWAGHPAVLQQLHLEPLVAAAGAVGSVVVFRQSVGATLLPGLPFADVHGGDLGHDAVLRAVVTGPERSFDQDPLLAFRLLAGLGRRFASPGVPVDLGRRRIGGSRLVAMRPGVFAQDRGMANSAPIRLPVRAVR